jgi:phospholipid/cholesterol/gamma-HCH transport system substrate-binding protein
LRRSWAAVTVGVFVIVVLAAAFTLFRYVREGMGPGQGYKVYALFGDAMGLVGKSRVRSAGLEIGQIDDRQLDQETGKAKIIIRIEPDIKLYENALVSKKAASLLGEYYLDIDPGTATITDPKTGRRRAARQLADGEQIVNVIEPVEIGSILNEVGSTLPILKEILRDVQELTSGNVKQIAHNVNTLIEKNSVVLERLLQRVDNIAASVEDVTRSRADDVKVSLANIREITEGLKSLVGAEGDVSKTGKDIRGSVQKLQASIDSLERSLQNVEKVTDKVAGGEGTLGKLVNDPAIADNVENITEDAGTFVRGLARLQTVVGLRSEYNYLANTFKTYFMVQLVPRPDKFYLVEVIDDPRGFREQSSTVINNSKDGTFSETAVKTSEKLRFSFQFGKRIGPLTGRFGIKESTGGVGLDLHLFKDRLALSLDVFDTRSNQYPRVQGRASYALYKRLLYAVAGVDDVLNFRPSVGGAGGFFDTFFGLQLWFNDEDLKSLLIVGGSGITGN